MKSGAIHRKTWIRGKRRMAPALQKRLQEEGVSSATPKYGAIRTGGLASGLEASVYQILKLREKAGEIEDIKRGPVDLGFHIQWNVDFNFRIVATKERVWAEAKGMETERYRICLKLWRWGQGPGKLEIWKGDWRRPTLVEIVIPKKESKNEKRHG